MAKRKGEGATASDRNAERRKILAGLKNDQNEYKMHKEEKQKDAITLHEMPLETRDDYIAYNREARRLRLPTKMIPHHLFPHQKVKFVRRDGQKSDVPVKMVSGKHFIDFHKKLKHGEVYELPEPVIEFLNNRAEPRYKELKRTDGSSQTVFDYWEPRFSCQMVV